MKLIDKAALVAKIEKWLGEIDKGFPNDHNLGRYDMCKQMRSFIDTLEVKEVDLDEEIDNIWNPRFNLGWDEKSLLSINHEGFTTIAKHFFELGLKAQKGDK